MAQFKQKRKLQSIAFSVARKLDWQPAMSADVETTSVQLTAMQRLTPAPTTIRVQGEGIYRRPIPSLVHQSFPKSNVVVLHVAILPLKSCISLREALA